MRGNRYPPDVRNVLLFVPCFVDLLFPRVGQAAVLLLEAAVVGRPDEDDLVKPEAFVVLADGAGAAPELETDLVRHCREGLPPYMYPRWIHFLDDLPKTATGKIQRFRLRS